MGSADAGLGASALGDTLAWAGPELTLATCVSDLSLLLPRHWASVHAAVEVHAVDSDGRIILDAEIDVLRDAETEVAGLAEVSLPQFVLFHLQTTLEDLFCFGSTYSDVNGDLLVTADAEGADGVSCFAWKTCISAGRSLSILRLSLEFFMDIL